MKLLSTRTLQSLLAIAVLSLAQSQVFATPFTTGDLAVFQADSNSANNTTFTIVEINPASSNGPAVQSIPVNGTTGPNALRTSGSATSTGYLALTYDRTLLSFDAHNSTSTSGNANTITARGVGTLDSNANFNLAATYTGTSGNQARDATSLNNSAWFISDQGGIYTNGATSSSPTANTRGIKSFGGTVYALQQSSTVTNIVVNTVSAPSGGTLTGLPGLSNDSTAVDFYMLSSGNNGSAYDELYLSTTAGISKYSLVGGTWVSNSSAAVGGLFGLAAELDPLGNGKEDLFATSGTGATGANTVLKFVDSAGWNQSINLGASTTVYTAPTGTTAKGIDFVPTVPEPTSIVLASLSFLGLAASARRVRKQA
jgi:hypothetical protein